MLLIHRSTISNIEYKMILKKIKISVLTQRWPKKKINIRCIIYSSLYKIFLINLNFINGEKFLLSFIIKNIFYK